MWLTNSFLWRKTLRLAATTRAVAVSPQSASVRRNFRLTASSRSLSISTSDVGLRAARRIAAGTGEIAIAGSAALHHGRVVAASTQAINVAGSDATLQRSRIVGFIKTEVTVEPQAVLVLRHYHLAAQPAEIALGTSSINFLKVAGSLQPLSAEITIAAQDLQMRATRQMLLGAAAIAVDPQAAAIKHNFALSGQVAEVALARPATILKHAHRIAAVARDVAIATNNATLTYTQNFLTLSQTHTWQAGGSISFSLTFTGVTAGDLIIALIQDAGSLDDTPFLPSGWTNLYVGVSSANAHRWIAKVAAGGESITTTFSDGASAITAVGFTPNKPISGFTANNFGAEFNAGNPSARTITASGQATPLIVVGAAIDGDGATGSAFSTASPAFDGTNFAASGSNNNHTMGWKLYNSSPANHSIDMNDQGTRNIITGGYVKVT